MTERGERGRARHVLHDNRRISQDVAGEMARKQPRIHVGAAADYITNHEGERLAAIETIRPRGKDKSGEYGRGRSEAGRQCCYHRSGHKASVSSWRTPRSRGRTVNADRTTL